MIRRKFLTVRCNILFRYSSKYNEDGSVKIDREIPFGLFTRDIFMPCISRTYIPEYFVLVLFRIGARGGVVVK